MRKLKAKHSLRKEIRRHTESSRIYENKPNKTVTQQQSARKESKHMSSLILSTVARLPSRAHSFACNASIWEQDRNHFLYLVKKMWKPLKTNYINKITENGHETGAGHHRREMLVKPANAQPKQITSTWCEAQGICWFYWSPNQRGHKRQTERIRW